MTTYVWSELRERVIDACGNTPADEQERRIIDVFREHPAAVMQGVDHVLDGYQRGIVRSPWAVLASHVEKLATAIQKTAVAVTDEHDRKHTMSRARQWMRAAGLHFDAEHEVEDELRNGFTSGMGAKSRVLDDEDVAELLAYWRELRVLGEQIDREANARAAVWLRANRPERFDPPPLAPPDGIDEDLLAALTLRDKKEALS